MSNPTAHIAQPVIACAVCGERGKWFASAHVCIRSERKQLFPNGANLWTEPSTLVAPLCSPACADEMVTAFDCPVFDKNFLELHSWLERWRKAQQKGRAA